MDSASKITPNAKTIKGEQTRAHILEVALELFRDNGYEETTMRAPGMRGAEPQTLTTVAIATSLSCDRQRSISVMTSRTDRLPAGNAHEESRRSRISSIWSMTSFINRIAARIGSAEVMSTPAS